MSGLGTIAVGDTTIISSPTPSPGFAPPWPQFPSVITFPPFPTIVLPSGSLPTSSPENRDTSDSSHTGVVIGASIGGSVGVLTLCLLVFWIWRRQRHSLREQNEIGYDARVSRVRNGTVDLVRDNPYQNSSPFQVTPYTLKQESVRLPTALNPAVRETTEVFRHSASTPRPSTGCISAPLTDAGNVENDHIAPNFDNDEGRIQPPQSSSYSLSNDQGSGGEAVLSESLQTPRTVVNRLHSPPPPPYSD
ncbi:hypothetical protein BXZ70DRAFT_130557 [Cristinia sonorae]|uniref:Uncharacterized protein n=1 Tax=Cristinia sonorae TaxID=1940300 RepID=A0A8K0UR28_9AGAR|nr:hypothetical protein BXZ70DRAFT_130557 [Cristinia sonorae]